MLSDLLQEIAQSQEAILDTDKNSSLREVKKISTSSLPAASTAQCVAPVTTSCQPAGAGFDLVGPTAAELESINELIRFDHVYYKVDNTAGSHQEVAPKSKAEQSKSVIVVQAPASHKKSIQPRKTVTVTRHIQPKVASASVPVLKTPDAKNEPEVTNDQSGFTLNISESDLLRIGDSLDQLVDFESLLQDSSLLCRPEEDGAIVSAASAVEPPGQLSSCDCSGDRLEQPPRKKKPKLSVDVTTPDTAAVMPIPSTPDQGLLSPSSILPDLDFLGADSISQQSGSFISDSGYGSDISGVSSPHSDVSAMESDSAWDETMESFTELFPSLI